MNEHMFSDLPQMMWDAVEGQYNWSDTPHIHIMRAMKFVTIGLIPSGVSK